MTRMKGKVSREKKGGTLKGRKVECHERPGSQALKDLSSHRCAVASESAFGGV
jgi:hypothetical protein